MYLKMMIIAHSRIVYIYNIKLHIDLIGIQTSAHISDSHGKSNKEQMKWNKMAIQSVYQASVSRYLRQS